MFTEWFPKTVESGDESIRYYDTGTPGDTIILIHDTGESSRHLKRLGLKLSKNYRVLTVDQRGHGNSTATGPYDDWCLAKDVLTVLEQETNTGHILGVGNGGRVALNASLLNPYVVSSVFLIDPPSIEDSFDFATVPVGTLSSPKRDREAVAPFISDFVTQLAPAI